MKNKAKKQIKEIKEREELSNYRVGVALKLTLVLGFLVAVHFVAFLLFGGEVK